MLVFYTYNLAYSLNAKCYGMIMDNSHRDIRCRLIAKLAIVWSQRLMSLVRSERFGMSPSSRICSENSTFGRMRRLLRHCTTLDDSLGTSKVCFRIILTG
jgi:hypothetical protein